MKVPTVHINGTGAAQLEAEVVAAYNALDAAVAALRAVTVHGRDYYPQGDNVIFEADREHTARLKALQAIRDEFLDYAVAVVAATDKVTAKKEATK